VVIDVVAGQTFLPLLDENRVGAGLASFLIHGHEHVLAGRDATRKLDRAEVAENRGGRLLQRL
jgi:hypothetical protein